MILKIIPLVCCAVAVALLFATWIKVPVIYETLDLIDSATGGLAGMLGIDMSSLLSMIPIDSDYSLLGSLGFVDDLKGVYSSYGGVAGAVGGDVTATFTFLQVFFIAFIVVFFVGIVLAVIGSIALIRGKGPGKALLLTGFILLLVVSVAWILCMFIGNGLMHSEATASLNELNSALQMLGVSMQTLPAIIAPGFAPFVVALVAVVGLVTSALNSKKA